MSRACRKPPISLTKLHQVYGLKRPFFRRVDVWYMEIYALTIYTHKEEQQQKMEAKPGFRTADLRIGHSWPGPETSQASSAWGCHAGSQLGILQTSWGVGSTFFSLNEPKNARVGYQNFWIVLNSDSEVYEHERLNFMQQTMVVTACIWLVLSTFDTTENSHLHVAVTHVHASQKPAQNAT